MAGFQDASTEASVLDTIPEDQPSNEWMPRNISLQRWWDVMTLRTTRSAGSSNAGSSVGDGNDATNTSIPSDEAEIQGRSEGGGSAVNVAGQPEGAETVAARAGSSRRQPCARTYASIIALVIALMAGAAVGIFFIVDSTKEHGQPAESMAPPYDVPVPSSTEAPLGDSSAFGGDSQTNDDRVEIVALLESISGDALNDSTTPQSMARTWLLNKDSAQVSIRVNGEERVKQRYALSVLYFALDGPNWKTDNFLASSSECDWTGITCNDADLDMALNLTGFGLNGSLPAEIGELSLLEQIVLSVNAITGDIPSQLWGLPFLYILNLGDNQLTGTLSSFLWDLPFLEYLYVNKNNLTGTLSELPSSVPPLKHIWLQENWLTGSLPRSLSKLVDLKMLIVYDNAFDATLDLQWSEMLKLFYLDVSWNQFSGSFPNDLAATTSLEFIYLNNNTLTGPLNENLGELRRLQDLWLQSNSFAGEIPAGWSEMKSLSSLLLYDNALTGSVPEAVCNLTISGNLTMFEADCKEEKGNGTVSCTCCTKCH